MKPLLHVLHIEDSKEDSELIKQLLHTSGIVCDFKRVETRNDMFDSLQNEDFDLILADCKLPSFSGLHALEIAHALKPETPFVFVSGTIGEETAIESLRNGATDYVLKDRLTRLAPAVRRALAEGEERTLCRQLQQRLHEAGRLEAISILSNGIAHDFNNILTIILGHASLLTLERDKPDRVLEITDTIIEAARRASEVVQQLLAFARKSEGHVQPLDLNRYLREHTARMQERLRPEIDLKLDLVSTLPNVMADPHQLDLILGNVLANCADALSGKGRVTLVTAIVEAKELPELLPQHPGGTYACLKIMDNGRGMTDATRAHIFEPFYTTKERGHATGLGLPVVYGLMQAQNGFVDVESAPGLGTTVLLYFPINRQQTSKPAKPTRGAEPGLCGAETILVVEDEPDVSFFLDTILQGHGYKVRTARDYEEARTVFDEHKDEIDLVFSDIGLPKVDGIALCSTLKKIKPELSVILASGYSAKEFRGRLTDLGSEAFLSKPYHARDILHTVRDVLDGRKAVAPV